MGKEKDDKKAKAVFCLSLIFTFLFAGSFLIMPAGSRISLNQGKNGVLFFAGTLFWISLLGIIISLIVLRVKRKRFNSENGIVESKLPALITFFSSKPAVIIDLLSIALIIALIVTLFLSDGFIVYILIFLTIIGFAAHCVINGKNLKYINLLKNRGACCDEDNQ